MQCISNSLAEGSNPDPDADVGTAGGRLVRVKMARKRRWKDIIVASLCTSKCMCTVYMKIQIYMWCKTLHQTKGALLSTYSVCVYVKIKNKNKLIKFFLKN